MTGGGKGRPFEDARDHAIIRMLTEGVRRTELVQLQTNDLPVDVIAQPFVRVVPLKGARASVEGRIVPLAPATARALVAYLRVRRGHRLAASRALWLGTRNRGALGGSGLYRMLIRRAEEAGYSPDVSPYKFRPYDYRAVVERRIAAIEQNPAIALIERPEHKRRWAIGPWDQIEMAALTAWLLNQCEDRALWYGPDGAPRPLTVHQLVDRLRADRDAVSVARMLHAPDADHSDMLAGILANEHVPYLAQFRYRPEGIAKRLAWEQTWNLQRQEDATGEQLDIPVPPKYRSGDFRKLSYWRHRGSLDMPKERFISYPDAGPDGDKSLLLGWAGWDYKKQSLALLGLIEERTTADGWSRDRIVPLLAGLAEVMPWVRQWHSEADPAPGQSIANVLDDYLAAQLDRYQLTANTLSSWTAPPVRRGRPSKRRLRSH